MGGDFIRYYIGNIHFSMLETIQRESGKFSEWQLIKGSEFEYKNSYGFEEVIDNAKNELLLDAIAKYSVIAEMKEIKSVKPAIIWHNTSNITDILTLLSIARASYHPILAFEKRTGNSNSLGWGLLPRDILINWEIVPISNLGKFILEAYTFIENNRKWLKDSGFDPSIYWYTQAQVSSLVAPSILEMGLYWVSLEVLAKTHNDNNELGIIYKKELVKRFINDKGFVGSNWNFLDKVIDDWYLIRNALYHEGNEPFPLDMLSTRRQQLRDFTSLIFVDMLQQQDVSIKEKIAKKIRNY
jgi:hypothetical protein